MKRLLPLFLSLAVLAGCGVPTEGEPRTVDPSVTIGSPEAPTSGASNPPGAAVEKLYLVRNNQLVAVERRLDFPPDLDRQLSDLLSGPTELERDDGIVSALTGTDLIAGVKLVNGTAIVDVGPSTPIRNDTVLAYGQIVCTLAARDDVDAVQFVQDGRPVDVPRADSSLTQDPLTVADYRALIAF